LKRENDYEERGEAWMESKCAQAHREGDGEVEGAGGIAAVA